MSNDNKDVPPWWWVFGMLVGTYGLAWVLFVPTDCGSHPDLMVCMNPLTLEGQRLALWALHWFGITVLCAVPVGSVLAIIMNAYDGARG